MKITEQIKKLEKEIEGAKSVTALNIPSRATGLQILNAAKNKDYIFVENRKFNTFELMVILLCTRYMKKHYDKLVGVFMGLHNEGTEFITNFVSIPHKGKLPKEKIDIGEVIKYKFDELNTIERAFIELKYKLQKTVTNSRTNLVLAPLDDKNKPVVHPNVIIVVDSPAVRSYPGVVKAITKLSLDRATKPIHVNGRKYALVTTSIKPVAGIFGFDEDSVVETAQLMELLRTLGPKVVVPKILKDIVDASYIRIAESTSK